MTITRLMRVTCGFVLGVLCFACAAMGQTETATVSGLITDDTGAVVPGAEVKLQSVERGTVDSATTNNAGIYVFASVHPGQYQLAVHKPGFKQVDLLGMIVNVQDHIEQNFRLQIGSVTESVTVEAGALTINTQDATVSTVVDRQFAENLPMNGRSFQSLIELTPGVVVTPSNNLDGGQFSVNGQRASSNYWMVDGVSANIGIGVNALGGPGTGLGGTLGSFGATGGTNSLVSVDAMQEFRIQTSTYAPEFGRTPGGQISIVTRSGTNQFHGTLFDYFRNDVLDANDWFAASKGLQKPQERQNDFGGTLSGPILRDRTFFFFSYEGLRLRLPQTTLTTVPCDNTCTVSGNARAMAVPAMQPYLNAFPLPSPNGKDYGNGTADADYSFSNPATLDAYSFRMDHKLSNKWTLFGRYNYSPSALIQRGPTVYTLSTLNSTRITTQTATLGATWVLSPAMTNDLRFNYSRTTNESHWTSDNFGGAIPLTSLSFPSPFNSQNGLLFISILPLQHNDFQVGRQGQNLQQQINIVDSLSVQKASHSLKFGVDFRRLAPRNEPFAYTQQAGFLDVPSAESGNLFFSAVGASRSPTFLFRNLGIYAQDTWRIAPRLTMTYGLRWDVDFVPQSNPSFPAVTGFNLSDLSSLALGPAGTPPYKTTYGNFAPRIGVAYQLRQSQDWQTVSRGGFGVFYDLATSETGNQLGLYPFANLTFSCCFIGTFPFSPATAVPPPITPSAGLVSFDPDLQQPYTLEWNIAFEQSLGKQQTISASYVGGTGRRLLQTALIFLPNASFQKVQFVTNTGTSDYNALQVQYQRRLSHGLQVLASYTWAHSIDTGSAGSFFNASDTFVPTSLAGSNRGSSDFDIRNAFSAGLTYDVPAPRINAFANAILRGWSTENIILVRSAPPVDISDGNFFTFNGGIFGDIRPDLVPGQPLYLNGSQYPGRKALNPAAFKDPPRDPITFNPLRQGNVPRNFLRGFGAAQWDFAVHRQFPIHESLKLQFRAEMFNVLNHPNFGQPFPFFGFGGFGLSKQMLGASLNANNLGGGALSPLYQIGGPRSVQFALKLTF